MADLSLADKAIQKGFPSENSNGNKFQAIDGILKDPDAIVMGS